MTMSQRIGWRSYVSPLSSLLTSIYGVWNAETTSTTLATSVYSAWNGEGILSGTQLSASMSNAWQGGASSFSATNYAAITASMSNLWKGDNNFNDSIGGLTGSSPNSGATPTFVTGKFGQAFSFDGVNDYVTLPTGSLKFTGDFSISMWVKATSWNTPRTLISNADINSVGNKWNGWWLDVGSSGKLSFIQVNNGTYNNSLTSFIALVPGVWSLVTVTRSSTRSTIYINGTNVGSVVNTISIGYSTTNFPCIGVNNYLSGIFQGWFVGSLEEIGIWQKSLTDNEVIGLYENGNGQSYPYSNPTTLVLDSYGTGHGIIKGATFSTGKVGTAFSFDGSSYVDLPIGTLNKTADFSVALWVYPTVNNTTMALISCRDGVKGWNIEYVSGNLWFWAGSGSNIQLQTGHVISLNTWTHILITFKAGVSTKSYINGVLTNTVSLVGKPSVYDNYSPYYLPLLGARRYQNPYTVSADQQAFFTGKIDAIGLWDRELTSSEASAIYNGGNGNEYPFSNASVSSPADSVSTKHGTIVGGVTYTPGVVGNALQFDGSTGYVSLPNDSLNFTGDFSVSLWVNFNGSNGTLIGSTCFGNNSSPQEGTSGWNLAYVNGYLNFNLYNDNSHVGLEKNNIIVSNAWNHIVITSKSGSNKIYANGVLVLTNTSTMRPNYRKTVSTRLGGSSTYLPNSYFTGKMDAVTTWSKIITDDEITQLYNMGGGIQYPFTTQNIRKPYSVYNGDDLVDAIGAKNATIVGGVTYTAGKIGNAYTFDGSTGYLTLPSTSLNFQGKSFSFSMWLKFNGTPANYATILSNCFTNKGFFLGVIGDQLYMMMGNGTGTAPQIQGPLVTNFVNKWAHITFVWEHGVGMKFYLNGELFNSVANTTTIDFTSLTTLPNIGRKVDGGGWGLLNGSIDGLTFWDSAVTPPEVFTLFNEGNGMEYPYSSTLPAKLPSYGDTVNTNHGTSPSGSAPTFTTGKIGKAFKFDGVNDYIALPNNSLPLSKMSLSSKGSVVGQYNTYTTPTIGSTTFDSAQDVMGVDYSISTWVYLTDVTSSQYVIASYDASGTGYQYGWGIYVGSGKIAQYENFGSSNNNVQATITANTWNHVVFVRKAPLKNGTDNGTIKVYINGTLIATTSPTTNNSIRLLQFPSLTTIGCQRWGAGNANYFLKNGSKIDALSVWDKQLTATEVTDLYNSGNGKQYPNY